MNSPKSSGQTHAESDHLASKTRSNSPSTLAIWSQFSGDVEHQFELSNAPKIRTDHSKIMKERHMKEIEETLRAVDLADIDEQRQTAPEYA